MTDYKKCLIVIINFLCFIKFQSIECGVLYPKASETRDIVSLDGLWHFQYNDFQKSDNQTKYINTDLNLMPVPSSYNDISTHDTLRDYVGVVVYSRSFFVPQSWKSQRVWIRFGSVCYNASVMINNKLAVTHEMGHFPFGAEITRLIIYGKKNLIQVNVNNALTNTTIPQGEVVTSQSGKDRLSYTFDYFPYAGIDRSVVLYSTNQVFIEDISISTAINNTTDVYELDYSILRKNNNATSYKYLKASSQCFALIGIVNYTIVSSGFNNQKYGIIKIYVLDESDKIAYSTSHQAKATVSSQFEICNARFWWPYLMDDHPGYQYTLRVCIVDENKNVVDTYDQKFGIRELAYDNDSFTINGKNIYIRGFGRHEDSDIRGKGLDLPLIIRDHNLIKWIGANAYRTSHYPYAEEIMDLADQIGIMIIDEVPAINTNYYSKDLLSKHKQAISELHQRDKNRPSVIVWSVANEPVTSLNASEDYYREVVGHIKKLDKSRPVTSAIAIAYDKDYAAQFMDIVSFNRYNGWYTSPGELDVIYSNIVTEATNWRQKHNKPVLITEYGADTLEGLHSLPQFIWSEEYQQKLMSAHFKAFDYLRSQGWFIGEMIWNFADFRTGQDYTRVGGNKKGVFTRARQPKTSAFLLRRRYWALATDVDKFSYQPEDLDSYVAKNRDYLEKNEL